MKLTTLDKNAGLKIEAQDLDRLSDFDVASHFEKYGCLWFSGLKLDTQDFLNFSDKYSDKFFSYRGGAFLREKINENETLLSVTGHSRGFPVPLHGELHYHPTRPEMIWFYCLSPALIGGETTVCDGEEFFNQLKPSTQDFLIGNKLIHIRTHDEKDWQSIYQSTSQAEVLAHCQEINLKAKFENNILTTEYKDFAVKDSPYTKNKTFINNILPMSALEDIGIHVSLIRDSEGAALPNRVLSDIRKVAKKTTFAIKWQKGDFLMIDNRRFLHGRKAFVDKKREIAVRMSNVVL